MEQTPQPKRDIKAGYVVAGAFLLFIAFTGDNLKYITDWSTAELVGYNAWGVFLVGGSFFLIYKGLNNKKK